MKKRRIATVLMMFSILLMAGVAVFIGVYLSDQGTRPDDTLAAGCKDMDRDECIDACFTKTNGESYKCSWRSATQTCKESSQLCDPDEDVSNTCEEAICKIGQWVCQLSNNLRTGYVCNCTQVSCAGCKNNCKNVYNCNTYNKTKCPPQVGAPIVNAGCGTQQPNGCISFTQTVNYYRYVCWNWTHDQANNGCNLPANSLQKSGSSICPSKPAGFCGWIQIDITTAGISGCSYHNDKAIFSWYYPCPTNPPQNITTPPVVTTPVTATTPIVVTTPITLTTPVVVTTPITLTTPVVVTTPITLTTPVVVTTPITLTTPATLTTPVVVTTPITLTTPIASITITNTIINTITGSPVVNTITPSPGTSIIFSGLPSTALISDKGDRVLLGILFVIVGLTAYYFGVSSQLGNYFWKKVGREMVVRTTGGLDDAIKREFEKDVVEKPRSSKK